VDVVAGAHHLGEFNQSSQHILIGGVSEDEEVEVGSIAACEAAFAWAAASVASRRAMAVRRLPKGTPARTRPASPACRRPSAIDGSDNAAACLRPILHHPRQSQQAGTSPSLSANKSRWRVLVEKAFERSPGSSVDRRRRSRASCGAMQQPAAAASNTVLTRRSGMPTAPRCGPSLPNC
jgi:hypothetical protein